LPRPGDAIAGWRQWLPAQLPVALIVAAAEAGVAGWLRARRHGHPYRPGALVTARSSYVTACLRRGGVASPAGCCLGLIANSGRRAEVSWPDIAGGLLITGHDRAGVTSTGLDLATAAIQHRKAVIIIDLTDGTARRIGRQSRSAGHES